MILIEELGLFAKELHSLIARCGIQLLVEHSEVSSLQGFGALSGRGKKIEREEVQGFVFCV